MRERRVERGRAGGDGRSCLLFFAFIFGMSCGGDPSGLDGNPPPSLECVDPASLPPTTGPSFVIQNVTVLTMTAAGRLEGQTLLVEDGLITSVVPSSEATVPAGADLVDGSCLIVMPGLSDMHTHLQYTEEILLYVANGVTTIREMWGNNARLQIRNDVEAGTSPYVAPTILQAGPGIDGDPPIWENTRFATNDPVQAAAWVEEVANEGYDFVKLYERLQPGVHAAATQRAADIGIPAIGHVPFDTGPDQVLTSSQISVEHLDDYYLLLTPEGQAPDWWAGPIDPALQASLAERIAADGAWQVATLSLLPRLMTDAERALFDATTEELRYLPPSILELWDRHGNYGQQPSQRAPALANQQRFLKALADAGANIMVGTDAGFSRIIAGFSIHDEMALMVGAGLGPEDVLRMATAEPARFMSMESVFGAVAAGMRADLLVLSADPTDDIANTRRMAAVVLRGEWLSVGRIGELLEQQAAAIATSPSGSEIPGGAVLHAHGSKGHR